MSSRNNCVQPFNSFLSPIAVALCLGSSAVSALPFVTQDANEFFSLLDVRTEQHSIDFEDQVVVGTSTSGGVETMLLPELTLNAQLPALKILDRAYTGNHNTTPNGRNYLSLDTEVRNGTEMTMTFGQPIYALGFNLIDHDTSDVTLNIAGTSYTLLDTNDGGVEFFGWILDDPLWSVEQISLSSGRDGQIALDDLFFAYWPPALEAEPESMAVSEPTLNSLLLVSLASVFGYRRFSRS